MMTFRGISVCVVFVAVMLMTCSAQTSTEQEVETDSVKPGSCPPITASQLVQQGIKNLECQQDSDCDDTDKCCLVPGGLSCVEPEVGSDEEMRR
ncbi:WAP four-disulfide core domain protein 5-like [Penaeus vannamei]|uniref:WAP four-disulfide core domain protein 5-like n=1 Tax=Penaeus vannamei TaxID=6689 RepID=UPI00387F8BE2